MRSIINEASGDRAMQHVLEMVPWPRVRSLEEYEQGHFRESAVMASYARQYGFSKVEIVSYPSGGRIWHAKKGELWMTEPQELKLYDVHDVLVSIGSGSDAGDVTGELVDVGAGRPDDFAGKEVKGRFVLTSGSLGAAQRLALAQGAVGAISYSSLRSDDLPDQISSQGVGMPAADGKAGMGWSIAPRVGRELATRLARGQKVVLRSIVEAEVFEGETELVHAMIPGDGSSDQALVITAHLYEGYTKQGANDDASGCALTLEMGRTMLRLVEQGKLPRPKRDIHFLWVPEISGTRAWLERNPEVAKRLIANLNFDMVGLGLRLSASSYVVHRTPDTLPSFLNDVCASVLEFVADLNRERLRFRSGGYGASLPVLSPNGSRDPFHVVVEKHYGASDHVVFIGQGIPAVMFITWPDYYYHSSQDTPDKLDPTQFKRAAVVGVGAMAVLATAGDEMAARVTAETLARGAERVGQAHRKGLGYLADVKDSAGLGEAFKEALNAVRHQSGIEKKAVRSSSVLYSNPVEADKRLSAFDDLIDRRAAALESEARAYYRLQAEQRKVPFTEPAVTDIEREAARLTVRPVTGAPAPARGQAPPQQTTPEQRAALQAGARIPSYMNGELAVLQRQEKTVLEIRDFLSGQFEPVPLDALMQALRAQEQLGRLELIPTAEDQKRGRREQ
jgi:aminopeptidase YwaD